MELFCEALKARILEITNPFPGIDTVNNITVPGIRTCTESTPPFSLSESGITMHERSDNNDIVCLTAELISTLAGILLSMVEEQYDMIMNAPNTTNNKINIDTSLSNLNSILNRSRIIDYVWEALRFSLHIKVTNTLMRTAKALLLLTASSSSLLPLLTSSDIFHTEQGLVVEGCLQVRLHFE